MNKTFTLAALSCALGVMAMAVPAEARVNQRQDRQTARINQGVHNGTLTQREARRLKQQQRHISRYEARSRADGGGLGPVERARLENMQDRASRNIYRKKHNRRNPG